jgi:hypothetical protein
MIARHIISGEMLDRLTGAVRAANGWIARNRRLFLVPALALFVGGTALCVATLELSLSDLAPFWLAALIAMVPLSFVYAAVNLKFVAASAGREIRYAPAFKVSAIAQFSELLPVPAGALVRGNALVQAGVSIGDAAKLVLVSALLWVSTGAIVTGYVIGLVAPAGLILAGIGSAVLIACAAWFWRFAGLKYALGAIGLRIAGLGITALRIVLAFRALGLEVAPLEAVPLAFATILGSASLLAPGGLGVSEALAATLAMTLAVSAQSAFLAVGLNRIVGLAFSGLVTLLVLRSRNPQATLNA